MGFVKQAMLLLLLAAVGTSHHTDPESEADLCHAVNHTVPAKDVHEVQGNWVLVWANSNNTHGTSMLKLLNTSHVEFSVCPDNKTLRFLENNVLNNNSKSVVEVNITLPEDPEEHRFVGGIPEYFENGVKQEYTSKGTFEFFKSPKDTVTMRYTDEHFDALLVYRREGRDCPDGKEEGKEKHKSRLRKFAECLKFHEEFTYTYHGDPDACHKNHDHDGHEH